MRIRRLKLALLFVWDNGPKAGWWLGVLYALWAWLTALPMLVRIGLAMFSFFALYLQVKRMVPEIRNEFLRFRAQVSMGSSEKQSVGRLEYLTDNVPTEKDLKKVYKYARNYAEAWASDGQLSDIAFYLKLKGGKIEKKAQVFLRSDIRGETLTTYVPPYFGGHNIDEDQLYDFNLKGKEVYSYPFWREGILKALERAGSDIAKADNVSVQISPYPDELSISLTFYKENGRRTWRRAFSLKDRKLLDGSSVVDNFNTE